MVVLLSLFSIKIYSQKINQTTFTLKEYKIKDSIFYSELCTVLFSDTAFGTDTYWYTKKSLSRFFLAMKYDTNTVSVDEEIRETFSANFLVFNLIDGNSILWATKNGKGVIGYFYIKKDVICFILDKTNSDFIQQYLIHTNKKRRFAFSDTHSFGGSTGVLMNILPNSKIEIIRVFKCD